MRYTIFHNQDALWFRPGTKDDLYVMGYSGWFPEPNTGSFEVILERIFANHNRDDRPDRYSQPSLSVGDVVVLAPIDQIGEPWAFTVDVLGWKELS